MNTDVNHRNTSDVSQLLACRASSYFDDFVAGDCEVQRVSHSRRVYSSLHEYVVRQGQREHSLIVKSPVKPGRTPQPSGLVAGDAHPRLHRRAPVSEKGKWEYHALRAIADHFGSLADSRFGAVRVLDLLPPADWVVMQKHEAYNLRRLLFAPRPLRWRRIPAQAPMLCHRAGAWLREFHRLPPHPWVRKTSADREFYVAGLSRVTQYLGKHTGKRQFFGEFQQRLARQLVARAPRDLPCAVLHGDFAPRNVLVGDQGAVAVLDTMACLSAAAHVDLAQFCTALQTAGLQASTLGCWYSRGQIRALERALRDGYFGEAGDPTGCTETFTGLALLERWGALLHRVREGKGLSRLTRATRVAVWGRHFHNCVEQLLHRLENSSRESSSVMFKEYDHAIT